MLSVPVYNRAGEKVGDESIDPELFGGKVNKQLLHDVVLMHLAARRVGTVNTRGRADVAGSGKKLFRQKGTGNARAGSKRTNKRKGGGMAFARRNRDYRYSMPKKAVRTAIRMALLSKFQDRQALVLDDLRLEVPKTAEIVTTLRALQRPDFDQPATPPPVEGQEPPPQPTRREKLASTLDGRTVLIGLPSYDPVLYRSARNIEGVQVAPVAEFNTYDILKQRYLLLTREALAELLRRVESKPARRAAASNGGPATATES